jgi:peroxiredoxin family protein
MGNPEEIQPSSTTPLDQVQSQDAADLNAMLANLQKCQQSLDDLKELVPDDNMTIVVFSGDMDKLIASLFLATGAASMGCKVSMYYTFWGLSALRKKTVYRNKNLWHRMLAWMLPTGVTQLKTSKMNFAGIGPRLFNHLMKKQHVPNLKQMLELAGELGIEMTACSTAMQIMGFDKDELIDGLSIGGVATYLQNASKARVNLFI